jgi:hypothetical protein
MIELDSQESEKIVEIFEDYLKSSVLGLVIVNEKVSLMLEINSISIIDFFVITMFYSTQNERIEINLSYVSIQKLVYKIHQYELMDYFKYTLTINYDSDMLGYSNNTNGFFLVFTDSNLNQIKSFYVTDIGVLDYLPSL